MIKKILLLSSLLFFAQTCFAMDINELNIEFFNRFNDENLNSYIQQALNNNHDLKKAEHVVEQYRQQVKYSLGKELPSFSVGANYLGIKVPELDNFQLKDNAFILPFIANYEADLLLKNRDKTRAVKKSYEAAKSDEKAIYLALLSDVATVYTNILQYDELIEKQAEVLKNQEEILERSNKKFECGVISTTELNNAKKNVETVRSSLENLKKERETAMMQLAVLTGNSSLNISEMKFGTLENFEYSGEIPEEISSEVIFARPDVKASEAKLEKAKIDVRVARKEFFPRFNIVGIWAFNTIAPGTFFSWESSLAAILAGATQDIFKGGMKVANLKIQKAKYEELFEDFNQTNLEAVKEVNTALCIIKYDKQIEENTKNELKLETEILGNAQRKISQGVISEPEYLAEENRLIGTQTDYAQAKTQRIVNYFTLYKAVGGQLGVN